MDVFRMNQPELYQELKKLAPGLAVGKSRARREVLERLVMEARDRQDLPVVPVVPVAISLPSKEEVRKAKKKSLKRKHLVGQVLDQKLVERHRANQKFVNITLTDAERQKLIEGLELLEAAGMFIVRAGLGKQQLGSLLYLAFGLDATIAGEAVFRLIDLKKRLLSSDEVAA